MKFKISIYNRHLLLLLFAFVISTVVSCSKMDDNYIGFVKNGEIVYTGKVDSLQAFPGNGRLQLKWLLVSDPKITKCKVYWNDGKDSSILDVKKTAATDTIKLILGNLKEGLYSFQVYTYDNLGHSSVKADVIGTVYGDNYQSSLFNRPLKSATWVNIAAKPTSNPPVLAFKGTQVEWYGVSDQAVLVELRYTNEAGISKTVIEVPVKDPNKPNSPPALRPITELPDYKKGTSFTYRTGYKPTSKSIDIFYTAFDTVLVP